MDEHGGVFDFAQELAAGVDAQAEQVDFDDRRLGGQQRRIGVVVEGDEGNVPGHFQSLPGNGAHGAHGHQAVGAHDAVRALGQLQQMHGGAEDGIDVRLVIDDVVRRDLQVVLLRRQAEAG